MNHHDVGRGRGGDGAAALAAVTAEVTVVGITSDRLYPLALQHELARLLPGCSRGHGSWSRPSGHDGFLVETAAVGARIAEALA